MRKNFSRIFYKVAFRRRAVVCNSHPMLNKVYLNKVNNTCLTVNTVRRLKKYENKVRTLAILKRGGGFFKKFVVFTTRYLLFRENLFYLNSRKIFKLARRSRRIKTNHKTLPLILALKRYSTLPYNGVHRFVFPTSGEAYSTSIQSTPIKLRLLGGYESSSNLKTNYKYLSLLTLHGGCYILLDYGPIIRMQANQKPKVSSIYKVRKKLNSFLEVNEHRQNVFNRRRLRFLKRLLFLSNVGSFFLRGRKSLLYYKHLSSVGGDLHRIYDHVDNQPYNSELKIGRVRFRPGYQRLWRNFRLAFAESIDYKYTYQKQLTKYISKFFRKLNQAYFSQNENRIDKVLIYSGLIPDLKSFETFFNNRMVYFNSKPIPSKLLYVYKNDFLQLEISNWYYIFSRWVLNTVIARENRFRRLVYRKNSASKYTVMKLRKDKSYYIPKWITSTSYDYEDVKPFIEVDFFTLSAFVVYDFNNIIYYTPEDSRLIRYGVYRLYNWKYIT